jgi:hypothetical protein
MTLNELKKIIDAYCQHGRGDSTVVVELDQVSIGPTAVTKITDIYEGLDWDMGKIIITSETPIIKKYKDRDIPVKIKHDLSISSKVICPICNEYVSKSDNYCKHCGQALIFESKHK